MNFASINERPILLITGSSGYIGSSLVEQLRKQYAVVGLDLEAPRSVAEDVHFVPCDLTSDDSVRSALHVVHSVCGDRIATVIHLAAYYDFSGEPSPLYRELTVEGTRRLLRGLRRFEVEQFVFASTLLVMKSSEDDQPLNTHSPTDAEWDYPQSKLAAEQVIRQERGSTSAVILRVAGVYDENCRALPIAQQIRRIYEKQLESYLFPGDASHGQSYVHINDLVDCVHKLIEKRGELSPLEIFLIGEEDVMSYEELQDRIGELVHGREWPTIRIPKTIAKVGAWIKNQAASDPESEPFIKPWMIDLADQNYPVSIKRARAKLGWQPQYSLRNTLPEMIRRLVRDPQRWYETNGLEVPEQVAQRSTSEIRPT